MVNVCLCAMLNTGLFVCESHINWNKALLETKDFWFLALTELNRVLEVKSNSILNF